MLHYTLIPSNPEEPQYDKLSKGFYATSLLHIQHHQKRYKKPEFANELADLITPKQLQGIAVLNNLFTRIHQIIE